MRNFILLYRYREDDPRCEDVPYRAEIYDAASGDHLDSIDTITNNNDPFTVLIQQITGWLQGVKATTGDATAIVQIDRKSDFGALT